MKLRIGDHIRQQLAEHAGYIAFKSGKPYTLAKLAQSIIKKWDLAGNKIECSKLDTLQSATRGGTVLTIHSDRSSREIQYILEWFVETYPAPKFNAEVAAEMRQTERGFRDEAEELKQLVYKRLYVLEDGE